MSKPPKIAADWIAADWGTTHLRVWAMANSGGVLARTTSDKGMAKLSPSDFEPALLELVGDWLADGVATPLLACGMAGSRQGWVEAPYQVAPCPPIARCHLVQAKTNDPRLDVLVIPGIKQPTPADVMRGEETQVAGLLTLNPDFDGVACLPGTHTKWIHIKAGKVIRFTTYLTGELFALLSSHSVLRHSVAKTGWDAAAFDAAVGDASRNPQMIAARLFSIRSESLISDLAPATARARLSGYLIGLELGASRHVIEGQKVVIIGEPEVSNAYHTALHCLGCDAKKYAADTLTLAGISDVYQKLAEQADT